MPLIYLDACAIIELRREPTDVGRTLTDFVVDASGTKNVLVTSELSLVEVLVKPLEGFWGRARTDEVPDSRDQYEWYNENLIANGILVRTLPIERRTLLEAALIRAKIKSMKTPDAIHAATAFDAQCAYFITGDVRLARGIQQLSHQNKLEVAMLTVAAIDHLRQKIGL
jgi:predicted nucleic acid-binding protein